MISCKEAGRFTSARLDGKLGLRERMMLRMHLALCDGCSRVDRQFHFLRRAVARYVGRSSEEGDAEKS